MNKEKNIINNVSATTAIDLKAELAQHVEQFEKSRASLGKQSTAKRPEKKQTVWTRQNKGIHERNQRDKVARLEDVQSDVLQRSREQLEKKARLYEAMRSGEALDAYDEEQDEEKKPLVDFDRKYFQERDLERQKEAAAAAAAQKKRKRHDDDDDEDDPWVEFEDEFGRTRIIRRSELPSTEQRHRSDDSDYDSEEEEKKAYLVAQQRYKAADRSNMNHFEADREIRTKGVGFYQFSKDEQERQAQMAKLNRLRAETENARSSQASASSKRKQMLAQNAEKIRARKAALKAKKHHQLKPEQQIPAEQGPAKVTEDSVTDFLKAMRKQVEQ
ncbi:hypothetical protein V8B55DRAFT_1488411 [Mucor lusitanicus]|uniref:CCDC174 alpha/beta GRSR domain-containing protein n=2 Tax=Mucor circinelloides f. lusitanicus TaxID=29924 RepID=A0A168M278_MUCCL|nr:hypothetical protein FB192DRAFT_1275648 [Mucor lusitanicus]OAD04277.1 hypothetical protein MUCCIDRAFT_161027 [Mucor lusitanicus CBS 277.49]